MPIPTLARLPAPFSGPHYAFHELRPPYNRGYRQLRVTSLPNFRVIHREHDTVVKNYLQYPRRNYTQSLPLDLWSELLDRNARDQFALNAEARIRFCEIACEMLQLFEVEQFDSLCAVTICPSRFVQLVQDGPGFNIHAFQQFVRQALGAVPFIGMVEAGLYRDLTYRGLRRADLLSWHAHLITSGLPRTALMAVLAPIMRTSMNINDGPPVHIRSLRPADVERTMIYMMKGQLREYRLNPIINRQTGVISDELKQQKRWMRTGDHVRMIRAFEGRRLDQLVFGSGWGTQLARAIRYHAMIPFCTWADQVNAQDERVGRPPRYPQVEQNQRRRAALRRDTGLLF